MMIYLLFLIYPFHTNWVNTDAQGLLFTAAPFVPPKHTLYLQLTPFLGYGHKPDMAYNPPTAHDTGDLHYYVFGTEMLGYTPMSQVELFVGGQTFVKYLWTIPYPLYRVDVRKIAPYPQVWGGVKIVFPSPDKKLSFGVIMHGAYWIEAGESGKTDPPAIAHDFKGTEKTAYEAGGRGLFGAKFPIGNFYVSGGAIFASVKKLVGDSSFTFIGINAGYELTMWPYFHPGVEYIKQDTFTAIVPQLKLLLGIVNLNFGLALPMNNFDWVPDYRDSIQKYPGTMASLNVGYTFPSVPPPLKNIVITGKAIDSISLEPVQISLAFIGPECGKMKSKKDGSYIIKIGAAGAYRLGIEAPDYKWQERIFELMDFDTVNADFVLKRKEVNWSIEGKVLSKKTKKGIPATVKLAGKRGNEVLTDPETGAFRIWVHSGTYNLIVSAEGYQTVTYRKVNIKNLKTLRNNILLLPEGMQASSKGGKGKKK
ncbi:MAG: carboxypeptidase regulatory-like domain-containing protein [bacterium]|nr:carboxypeptidase regulatory-like domain-containing protein [bacterium]